MPKRSGRIESAARQPSRAGTSSDFQPDYSYVRSDLRRIAGLAGAFLALLVILSFFLN
jgi:hypothetical protein